MNTKQTARSLHPLERKVLPKIVGEVDVKDLVKETGLKEVEVMRAVQWLSNKKLVEILLDLGSVCIAYTAHPTTHLYPICIKQGIIYYCVANMPGIYSKTSTLALTNLTLRYVKKIAQKGIEKIFTDKDLIIGLYIYKGKITYKKIAGNLNMLDRYSKIIN